MTTNDYTMTKTDLDYIFIICFPQDSVPAKTDFQLSQLECMNFFKTVKPDALFIRKTNTTVFIPFIETNIAALLFNNFSKTLDNDCVVFTESLIGIKYRGKIRFCHHINSDNLQELLLCKYISNRVCYSVKHEEVQNICIPKIKPEQITSEFFEPEVSVENYWKHLYIKPKHKKLEWKSKSKKILEVIQNKDLLSEVQNYLKNDSFTHYRKRKHCPSVWKDELSEANQVKTDQEKDAVSISYATKDGKMQKNTKTRKSPILRKMTGNYSRQYRMLCTDLEDIIEIDVNKRLSNCDSENILKYAGKKKTISIKDIKNKDVSLKLLELEVRKDFQDEHLRQDFGKNLQEITNLPLRWYPVRRQDIIVCPGGRKKKNDRQTERRPQQRSQAQNQSIHAQPTEDDPVPDSLYTLSSDRFALPSQPDQRNLQHLVSSFTPRVEPISASTQQLRRLATRPRHQQYEEESARRESFNDWPSNTGQNHDMLKWLDQSGLIEQITIVWSCFIVFGACLKDLFQ